MSTLADDRRLLRRCAAGLCLVMAAVYLLIAAGVSGIESTEEMSIVTFGVGAASIFVVGAVLLLALDNRVLWGLGAAMQVMMAVMYLAVSSDRSPAFEAWGIGLRVLQLVLFVLLVLLTVRHARPAEPDDGTSDVSARSTLSGAG